MTIDKIREDRVRRALDRRGMRLAKIRRRDRNALDYGHYQVFSRWTGNLVDGETSNWTFKSLESVEAWMTKTSRKEKAPAPES